MCTLQSMDVVLFICDVCFTVNGGWNLWSEWSDCSCSSNNGPASHQRSRTCDHPSPQNGGQQCIGADVDIRICENYNCELQSKSVGLYMMMNSILIVTM